MRLRKLEPLARTALFLWAILLAAIVRYHPLHADLDAGWAWALNALPGFGVVFGRDVAFTYGPLGRLILPMNIGANLLEGITFQAAIWAVFSGALAFRVFVQRAPLAGLVLFAAGLFFGRRSFDSTGYAGPDVFMVLTVLVLLGCSLEGRKWHIPFGAAVALAALLGLVQFSSFAMAAGACGMFAVGMWLVDRQRAIQAVLMTLSIPALLFVYYLVYYPSPEAFLRYLRAGWEISSGFSVVMTQFINPGIRYAAAILGCCSLAAIGLAWRRDAVFPLGLSLLLPLFISYKHSFIRESGHHHIIFAFVPWAIGVLVLFASGRTWKSWAPLLPLAPAAALVWAWPESRMLVEGAWKVEGATVLDLTRTERIRSSLDGASEGAMKQLRLPPAVLSAVGSDPVAVFPWSLQVAAANPLRLRPFPIFQSYSAYTPYLEDWNAAFLREDERAPRKILLQWAAIDGRHPLADVPATALEMFRSYEPAAEEGGWLVLRRRSQAVFGGVRTLRKARWNVGEPWAIPLDTSLVRCQFRWNWLGKLRNVILGIPAVEAVIETESGRVFAYRIVTPVLTNGFPTSLMPHSLAEFQALMSGSAPDRVTSVTVAGRGATYLARELDVELCDIEGWKPPPRGPSKQLVPRGMQDSMAPEILNGVGVAGRNDVVPVPDTDGIVRLTGWATDGLMGESAAGLEVWIDGRRTLARVGLPRPDVAIVKRCPGCLNSGFEWVYPSIKLGRGEHTLEFRIIHRDGESYYQSPRTLRFRIE